MRPIVEVMTVNFSLLAAAWRTGSFAAEITSQIMEGAFDELDMPVARVCSAEVPMCYAKHLEDAALPPLTKITEAVLQHVLIEILIGFD